MKKEEDMIVYHCTDKDNVGSIIKNGIRCTIYKKDQHPLAIEDKCFVFGYPADGLDEEIKFRPRNARLRNEEIDDEWIIAFKVEEAKVGDTRLEGIRQRYIHGVVEYKTYLERKMRRKFREPEVTIEGSISPSDIIGALPFSIVEDIFNIALRRTERQINFSEYFYLLFRERVEEER